MALDNVFVNYTSGTDSPSNGAIGSPVKTVQYGIGLANPGADIWLRGGTHITTTYIGDNWLSGSSGNPTTLQNYDDEDVVIQRSGGDGTGMLYINKGGAGSAKSYITITGSAGHPIIIDGGSKSANGGVLYSSPASGSHSNIILGYLTIRNCDDSGIITGSSNNGWIHHIISHNNGTLLNQDHGLYVSGSSSDNLIEDCEFYENFARGFQNHGTAAPSRNIYRRINSHNNGAQGMIFSNGTGCVIEYSLMWSNGSCGLQSTASGNFFYNNSCYNNNLNSSAPQVLISGSGCTLRNNISLAGNNGNWTISGGSTTQSNNVFATAVATDIWTDPANGDFSLKNTAGTPSASVTTYVIDQGVGVGLSQDFEGTSVPQGAAPDIGHLEWGADPPDAPSATHDTVYVVSTVYGDVSVTLVKGTNNIVECTLSGTGAAALCVDNTDVTLVRN